MAGALNTPSGADLLITAVHHRDTNTVATLLAQCVSPNAREPEYNDTALMWAAKFGNIESAVLLLESGAEIDAVNRWGDTALAKTWGRFHRSEEDALAFVDLFFRYNAAPNILNNENETALMKFIQHTASPRLLKKLLARGADPSIEVHGFSALSIAQGMGPVEITEILVNAQKRK